MQAIYTTYRGATNYRGARIFAKASGGFRLVVSYDYATDAEMNHLLAAKALAEKLGWHGDWIEGGGLNGRENVYVNAAGDSFTVAKTEG